MGQYWSHNASSKGEKKRLVKHRLDRSPKTDSEYSKYGLVLCFYLDLNAFRADMLSEIPNYPVTHPPLIIDDELFFFTHTEDENEAVNEIKLLSTNTTGIYTYFYSRVKRIVLYTSSYSPEEIECREIMKRALGCFGADMYAFHTESRFFKDLEG
jgi:hypothetical protein